MPIANITGFSVGQDLRTLLITGPFGQIDSTLLGRLEEFNATPVISNLTVTPVNNGGLQLLRNVYHGWDGNMTFARYNNNMLNFQSAIMAIFNLQGQESYFSIEAVVVENITLAVNTLTFVNAVIHNVNAGDFTGAKAVNQSFAFRAQQLLINGNASTSPSLVGG
jgi:hypothetical protein